MIGAAYRGAARLTPIAVHQLSTAEGTLSYWPDGSCSGAEAARYQPQARFRRLFNWRDGLNSASLTDVSEGGR